jgi:hypothetical protein
MQENNKLERSCGGKNVAIVRELPRNGSKSQATRTQGNVLDLGASVGDIIV